MECIIFVVLTTSCLFAIDGDKRKEIAQPYIINKTLDTIFSRGHWTSWSFHICDAVCGEGRFFRKRFCVPTDELFGIPTCLGRNIERTTESCDVPCPSVDQLRTWYFGPTLPQATQKALTDHLTSTNFAFNRKVGGSVQLDCYNELTVGFLVNYTKSVIYWEKNGARVQFDVTRMMVQDYVILGLNDLRTSDMGVYTCNVLLSKKFTRTITIFSLMGKPFQLEVSSASDVRMPCNVDVMARLFRGLHVQWIVNTSRHVIKEYRLDAPRKESRDVIRVKRNHTGMWACVVQDTIYNRTWVTNAFHVRVHSDWPMEVWKSTTTFVRLGIVSSLAVTACALFTLCICRHSKRYILSREPDELEQKMITDEDEKDEEPT